MSEMVGFVAVCVCVNELLKLVLFSDKKVDGSASSYLGFIAHFERVIF